MLKLKLKISKKSNSVFDIEHPENFVGNILKNINGNKLFFKEYDHSLNEYTIQLFGQSLTRTPLEIQDYLNNKLLSYV